MSKEKELAKNTLIISVGKICTQMVSFFLLPLYTKILTTEDYGTVDVVMTYVQLLLPVITCQLEQAIFRFLIDKRNDEKGKIEILSSIFTLTLVVASVFSILFCFVSFFIPSKFKYFLLVNLLANMYSSMMLQTSRGLGKNTIYAMGSFISAAGQVILNVIFVVFFRAGATGMLVATFTANILCGSYVYIKVRAYKYIRIVSPSINKIKPYLKYSLPLVPNAISWWILSASDRTIVVHFLGVAINGVYSAANKISGIYTTIFNIFNLSWTETVSLHLKEKDSSEVFTELQSTILKIFTCMYLGIVSVVPFVFDLMIDKKFGDAYYQIPILSLGAFFCALIGISSAYYIADKQTKIIAKTSILCAILNIIVDIALVTRIGLYAASISTVIAYVVLYLTRYIDIRKKFGVKIQPSLIISALIMTCITFTSYYSRNIIYCLISLLSVVIYSVYMNQKLIIKIIVLLKNRSVSIINDGKK